MMNEKIVSDVINLTQKAKSRFPFVELEIIAKIIKTAVSVRIVPPTVIATELCFDKPSRLLNACLEGADLTIGSRYCRGGKVKNWPLDRILMSYFASIYVRLILFIGIKDTTAGFKCYRTEVLKKIKLDNVSFKGYAFQICMKYAAIKHGFKVKEIPITFIDRVHGESKMSTGIFKEAFFGVWKMRKMNL